LAFDPLMVTRLPLDVLLIQMPMFMFVGFRTAIDPVDPSEEYSLMSLSEWFCWTIVELAPAIMSKLNEP
jgi:hypothetical protein